jgi:hypothetical protein
VTSIPSGIRRQVLDRDGHRCRYCGTTNGLHLHHIGYRSQGGDHSVDNLITLCGTHHGLVHGDKRRWMPVLCAYVELRREGRSGYLLDVERRLRRLSEGVAEQPPDVVT